MTTLSKTETSQTILDKLSMFIQDSDSKVSAAMALGTSPRSLVRWADRVHPVPERVVEILNEEYPDEDNAENAAENDDVLIASIEEFNAEKTFASLDTLPIVDIEKVIENVRASHPAVVEELSSQRAGKSILDVIHSIEHADPNAEATPVADDEERVILLTAHVKGYGYPLFVTVKSIEHREGNQFSLVRGTSGTLILLNMANVTSLKTELLPVSDSRVVMYREYEETLSPMTALIVGSNTHGDVPVDLDIIVMLRSGKIIAECEFGGVVEEDIEDINFVILDEEAAKLF